MPGAYHRAAAPLRGSCAPVGIRRVTERGYELTPENIALVSDEIRQETDQYFLRVLIPDLKGFASSLAVLIDCLREDNDLLTLRELSDSSRTEPISMISIRSGLPPSSQQVASRSTMT